MSHYTTIFGAKQADLLREVPVRQVRHLPVLVGLWATFLQRMLKVYGLGPGTLTKIVWGHHGQQNATVIYSGNSSLYVFMFFQICYSIMFWMFYMFKMEITCFLMLVLFRSWLSYLFCFALPKLPKPREMNVSWIWQRCRVAWCFF